MKGQTVRHDEVNSGLSQFSERA